MEAGRHFETLGDLRLADCVVLLGHDRARVVDPEVHGAGHGALVYVDTWFNLPISPLSRPKMTPTLSEAERLKQVYCALQEQWAEHNPGNRAIMRERSAVLDELLRTT